MKKIVLAVAFLIFLFKNTSGQKNYESFFKTPGDSTSRVYREADEMPYFPSGSSGFLTLLIDSLRYPERLLRDHKDGQVKISFIVNADGSITDVRAVRGFQYDMDKEAERFVNSFNRWIPGKINGHKVNVKTTIEIPFISNYHYGELSNAGIKVFLANNDTLPATLSYGNIWQDFYVKNALKKTVNITLDNSNGYYMMGYYYKKVHLNDPPCALCKKDVFVQELISGPISLYKYTVCKAKADIILGRGLMDKCIDYYYLKKEGDENLFTGHKALSGIKGPQIRILTQDNSYSVFCDYFKDCPEVYSYLVSSDENKRREIKDIVFRYNFYQLMKE